MDDLSEAIENIDVFCRALVRKALEENGNIKPVEPIEDLFRRKYIANGPNRADISHKNFIPLPQLEEPLIDIFEDDDRVKVLMQCRCRDEEPTMHFEPNKAKICKKICHTNSDGIEVCRTDCKHLDLPLSKLRTDSVTAKCNNNQVFEVEISKNK